MVDSAGGSSRGVISLRGNSLSAKGSSEDGTAGRPGKPDGLAIVGPANEIRFAETGGWRPKADGLWQREFLWWTTRRPFAKP